MAALVVHPQPGRAGCERGGPHTKPNCGTYSTPIGGSYSEPHAIADESADRAADIGPHCAHPHGGAHARCQYHVQTHAGADTDAETYEHAVGPAHGYADLPYGPAYVDAFHSHGPADEYAHLAYQSARDPGPHLGKGH